MQTYNRLCPGLVPEVYDYDEEMSLMVMEYLGKYDDAIDKLLESGNQVSGLMMSKW